MRHAPVPREFEHVAMADQVRLDVSAGVFEAVAHASLCTEVDDAADLDFVGEALQGALIGEIQTLEAEAIAELLL